MRISKAMVKFGAIIVLALAGVVFILLFQAWTFTLLEHTNVLQDLVELPNSSKSVLIEKFTIIGGATSNNVTQIVIRHTNDRFNWETDPPLFSIEGLKKVEVRWMDDATLKIEYEPGTVYQAAAQWNGVRVIYSQLK